MDAAGWVGLAGLVTALLGGITGIIAALARRTTDAETAEDAAARRVAEERAALTQEYRALLEDFRVGQADREARHERELDVVTNRLAAIERDLDEARAGHRACEENLSSERRRRESLEGRLRAAERRLAELGGDSR